MRHIFLIAILSSTLLFGCSTPSETTDETAASTSSVAAFTNEDRDKIAADDRAFEEAFNTGDIDAIMSFYAEDAVVLAFGGAPAQGHDEIRALISSLPAVKDLVLADDELVGFGNHVYMRGTISMTIIVDEETEVSFKGNYLVTRERQADGTWLYTNDMFSEEAAPAE